MGAVLTTGPLAMATDAEKQLLALLRRLPQQQVQQLLDYAQYLLERHGQPEEVAPPTVIPRPPEEAVLQAIKRLSTSYPMLDEGALFNETSVLMTQYILGGRGADEIIDELERLFRRHYESLIKESKDDEPGGILD